QLCSVRMRSVPSRESSVPPNTSSRRLFSSSVRRASSPVCSPSRARSTSYVPASSDRASSPPDPEPSVSWCGSSVTEGTTSLLHWGKSVHGKLVQSHGAGRVEQRTQLVRVRTARTDELEQQGGDGEVLDVLGVDLREDLLHVLGEGALTVEPAVAQLLNGVRIVDETVDGLAHADGVDHAVEESTVATDDVDVGAFQA